MQLIPPQNALNGLGQSLDLSAIFADKEDNLVDKWHIFGQKPEACPHQRPTYLMVNYKRKLAIRPNCNQYSCPVCGPIKVRKLQQALVEYFKQFKYMRILTLTLSCKVASSPSSHYELLQKAFKYFMTEIRRNKLFSKKQNNVQYVKMLDIHTGKRGKEHDNQALGYFHYHILISEYIPYDKIQTIWEKCCKQVSGETRHIGQSNIKGILNNKAAASYVCKYVTKIARYVEARVRRYSKSGKASIFPKKLKSRDWIFFRNIENLEEAIFRIESGFNLTCNQDAVTSQVYTLNDS